MLTVKNQTVIDCLQLSDTKTRDAKNDVISKAGTLLFHFMGEYLKLDVVKPWKRPVGLLVEQLTPFHDILR